MATPTAIVVGVGAEEGIGAAVSRRFAREGFHVTIAGRTQAKLDAVVATIVAKGGSAEALICDATDENDVAGLFSHAFAAPAGKAPPEVVVFNAGDNRRIPFVEIDAAWFEHSWRIGCYAGFLVGREAAKRLAPLGRGTIIFTGASGSLRGKDGFAAFAAAKAGLRMISQSMAREFGPQGLHVAHVVVDGVVNGARIKSAFPQAVERLGADGMLGVDHIADAYWAIHTQHPTAWTQELDLRPHREAF